MRRAWSRFNRDIDNETGKTKLYKHQEFFERKLTSIATHGPPGLAMRAKRLRPFVLSAMRQTHQPYKSLAGLHRKIDRDTSMDDPTVLQELESIQSKYGHVEFLRIVHKPQILYSMMVSL